jgi:hypothetical protein
VCSDSGVPRPGTRIRRRGNALCSDPVTGFNTHWATARGVDVDLLLVLILLLLLFGGGGGLYWGLGAGWGLGPIGLLVVVLVVVYLLYGYRGRRGPPL